jgi:plasmid maintenance system antidote protein VapI
MGSHRKSKGSVPIFTIPEMALRIEMAFGVSMDVLMHMQNSYDIARVHKGAKSD